MTVPDKSVIIIGAGIAGLSAGCYAQMNGYRSRIVEMHDRPGGLCTSWKRNGYTINGCIHLLVGTGHGSEFRRIWEELGAIQDRRVVNYDEFVRFESSNGRTFVLSTDIDKLEHHMLELAPADHKLIKQFIGSTRKLTGFEAPVLQAPELYGPIEGLRLLRKMLPHAGTIRKWLRVSMRDFSRRFTDPLLREVFSVMWFPEVPVLFAMVTIAMMHRKSAGYPVGGSLDFSRAIERRYLGLGGQVHYGARVSEILVQDDRAVGVKLEDGSEHHADCVISAADAHAATFDMLHGRYVNRKIRSYYEDLPIFPPLIYISLGLGRSFDAIPSTATGLSFPLPSPIAVAGEEVTRLGVRIHDFDPTLAPAGRTLMRITLPSNYAWWERLQNDPDRYQAEKRHIADSVIAALDARFPGLADAVEMRDVATPLTFHRYTGNWQGSHEGWLVTTSTWKIRMKKTLPGLSNFYMAGHWVQPGGGVPSAAMSARNVIQLLCRRDKKPFTTTVP
jgi:phytoene dehydrogenase-like protein